MELNPSKLLLSCKNYPTYSRLNLSRNWANTKIIKSKSNSILNRTQILKTCSGTSNIHTEVPKHRPVFSGIFDAPSLKLEICAKKISVGIKSDFKPPNTKQDVLSSNDKICHTFAIPKKLKAFKRDFSVGGLSETLADVRSVVSKNDLFGKKNIFVVKSYSKGVIRRNECFHENRLKKFSAKLNGREVDLFN